MPVSTGTKRTRGKKPPAIGMVRVFEIYTPVEDFTGTRLNIKFQNGRAELPEPRPEDFSKLADYEIEKDAFEVKVKSFVSSLGYEVSVREVEVGAVTDRVDKENFDPLELFRQVSPIAS